MGASDKPKEPFDADKAIDEYGASLGIPAAIIRCDKEVEKLRRKERKKPSGRVAKKLNHGLGPDAFNSLAQQVWRAEHAVPPELKAEISRVEQELRRSPWRGHFSLTRYAYCAAKWLREVPFRVENWFFIASGERARIYALLGEQCRLSRERSEVIAPSGPLSGSSSPSHGPSSREAGSPRRDAQKGSELPPLDGGTE